MLLSTSLPKDDEIDKLKDVKNIAAIKRSGFSDGQRRKNIFAIKSGVIVENSQKFDGQVVDISPLNSIGHPVYRFLTSFFFGVDYEL
jgi:CRISPR/Cas system CSM-associated protein Csm4 (group 5 of RAMP superfamily)